MRENVNINEELDLAETNEIGQNDFLQSTLGKIVNFSVDSGLRAILPDVVENEVINIKDTLINEGFSEAINSAINNAINFGKSAIGVITGNFENISQAEKAIEKGGIIDGVSSALDFILDKVSNSGFISNDATSVIKDGKDVLLDNVSSNIKKEFTVQSKNIEDLNSQTKKWKENYQNQDFEKMEKNIKKIKSVLNKTMPIENLISEARTIENLHELIKNNDNNFNLTDEQMQLASLLS